LKTSKENGWDVFGTDLSKNSRSFKDLHVSRPSIIVFGNEGQGISESISKICSEHLIIPGGNPDTVDSLNVSVSAGILINEFKNRLNR
jgi:tRNA G18 (ribose-2'-O)-methylase SpoU